MPRILYVNPMPYGANPGVDAIAHGLDRSVAAAGFDLGVVEADFARADAAALEVDAIDRAIADRAAAIVLYTLDPLRPAEAAARARAAGIPVVTFERPRFPVDASLVYPNFNQGAYLGEELAARLGSGARVAVVGGPKIIDDDELVAGIVAGVTRSGLVLVNDPTIDRHRNESDLRPGGREATLRVLADHPDVAGLVPFNDETMLGALDALEELGRLGSIATVSRNGTPKAIAAVRAGRTVGTWDIDPPAIGAAVAALTIEAIARTSPAGRLAIGPIGRFFTRENVGAWQPWDQRVSYRPLLPW
jgi:ABC-type sugar transport system substrate-binding protein